MFSQTAEYALRAMIALARHPDGESVLAKDLAQTIGVTRPYLGKILGQLVRTGLLRSTRGRQGGFQLQKDPCGIPLIEVVEPFQQMSKYSDCILGRETCVDDIPCPLHAFWKDVRERFVSELETRTLAEVAGFEEIGAKYSLRR